MCDEETISPSTSTSSTMRVSNAASARSSAVSPLARWPKRKFSPTDTRSAPTRLDQHVLDELLRRCDEKTPSNGTTTSSVTPRPATRSALVPAG